MDSKLFEVGYLREAKNINVRLFSKGFCSQDLKIMFKRRLSHSSKILNILSIKSKNALPINNIRLHESERTDKIR